MNSKVMFSSGKDDWRTPTAFFAERSKYRHYTLDAAADSSNHLCKRWLGPGSKIAEDALNCSWGTFETIWLNPPYSLGAKFIAKASQEARAGGNIVDVLIPARTDTKWFHEFVWDRDHHRLRPGVSLDFIKGRIKFEGGAGSNSAPFPSMIVTFRPLL